MIYFFDLLCCWMIINRTTSNLYDGLDVAAACWSPQSFVLWTSNQPLPRSAEVPQSARALHRNFLEAFQSEISREFGPQKPKNSELNEVKRGFVGLFNGKWSWLRFQPWGLIQTLVVYQIGRDQLLVYMLCNRKEMGISSTKTWDAFDIVWPRLVITCSKTVEIPIPQHSKLDSTIFCPCSMFLMLCSQFFPELQCSSRRFLKW